MNCPPIPNCGVQLEKVVTDLNPSTTYLVRVRACNSAGCGPWSEDTEFTTKALPPNSPNSPPSFGASLAERSVPENSAAGTNVGSPITATDPDGDTLSYSLTGTNTGKFTIDGATGQLKVGSETNLDHETQSSYVVTVQASDGNGGTDSIGVTINVTDVAELETPTGLTVSAETRVKIIKRPGKDEFSLAELSLDWDDVSGDGITYEVELIKGDERLGPYPFTQSSAKINVAYDTRYLCRVRSVQDEARSEWSPARAIEVPLPYYGHQADHVVKYEISSTNPTPVPGVPESIDPGHVIPTAIAYAAGKWNSAAGSTVTFCEGDDCKSDNTDGRTVLICAKPMTITNDGDPLALVARRGGLGCNIVTGEEHLTDDGGHMNDLVMHIGQPAEVRNPRNEVVLEYVWTNDATLHRRRDGGRQYYYLPAVAIHEFGHTAGLFDLYRLDAEDYDGYIMGDVETKQDTPKTYIPSVDRNYLRDVYRDHTPHLIPSD